MAWADDDDFSVDDLLVEPEQEGIDDDEEGEGGCLETYSSPKSSDNLQHKYNPSIELDLFHITEDVAELEWVSRFVDDSLFEYPPSQSFSAAPAATGTVLSWRQTMVPVKARSKRPRKSFSNSSSTSSTSSSARTANLIIDDTRKERKKRGRKKKKKNEKRERECSHCGVEKTPQWRAGPMGAKTLCNACGVRFKSGRLLPEYRPACSPTFVSSVHSNCHRKVLEMRRVKDEDEDEQLQLGFC